MRVPLYVLLFWFPEYVLFRLAQSWHSLPWRKPHLSQGRGRWGAMLGKVQSSLRRRLIYTSVRLSGLPSQHADIRCAVSVKQDLIHINRHIVFDRSCVAQNQIVARSQNSLAVWPP